MAIKDVNVREAHAAQQRGAVYVDVRSIPEFELGHPAGAVNVPLMHRDPRSGRTTPNSEFLAVMQKAFPADAELLVACQAGVRSLHAASALEAAGFSHIANVTGGFGGGPNPRTGGYCEGWAEAGLPVGRGDADGEPYQAVRERAGVHQPG